MFSARGESVQVLRKAKLEGSLTRVSGCHCLSGCKYT